MLPAALAVAVVELFEITNGFGVMSNVYDPIDLVANVMGVTLAWACGAAPPIPAPRACGRVGGAARSA